VTNGVSISRRALLTCRVEPQRESYEIAFAQSAPSRSSADNGLGNALRFEKTSDPDGASSPW
jgi:hypothetical protein